MNCTGLEFAKGIEFFDGLDLLPKNAQYVVLFGAVAVYLHNNRHEVVNKLASTGSVMLQPFYGIHSFFSSKKNDNDQNEFVKAINYFNKIDKEMSDEYKDLILEITQKQQAQYDPNGVEFIKNLGVAAADYPKLPHNVSLLSEVEESIKALKEHHAKVQSRMIHYIESSPPEATQSNTL